jgi:glycyl-tRNA synthetase beta subunit
MSFSKFENIILPDFRNKLNHAESTEDLKKFFAYSVQELFKNAFSAKMTFDYYDIVLLPDSNPYYQLSARLLAADDFREVWDKSDLPQVIGRLAKTAAKHHIRLEKNPGKTESKIRM